MKSVKSFIIYITVLYLCLLLIDWLKATYFAVNYHSFFIWFKTLFLVTGGIAIMYITLQRSFFKTFLIIYLPCWFLYFLLKKLLPLNGIQIAGIQFYSNELMASFLNFTQLYTPLPFLVFWLLNRVFVVVAKDKRDAIPQV